jgi:hypothetical protein
MDEENVGLDISASRPGITGRHLAEEESATRWCAKIRRKEETCRNLYYCRRLHGATRRQALHLDCCYQYYAVHNLQFFLYSFNEVNARTVTACSDIFNIEKGLYPA